MPHGLGSAGVLHALTPVAGFLHIGLASHFSCADAADYDVDVDVEDSIAKGELAPITAWLHEKVHQYGGLYVPADVVRNACGTFDPHYYTDYLTRKFSELYGL